MKWKETLFDFHLVQGFEAINKKVCEMVQKTRAPRRAGGILLSVLSGSRPFCRGSWGRGTSTGGRGDFRSSVAVSFAHVLFFCSPILTLCLFHPVSAPESGVEEEWEWILRHPDPGLIFTFCQSRVSGLAAIGAQPIHVSCNFKELQSFCV